MPMMYGFGMFAILFWALLGTAVVAVAIWLLVRRFNRLKTPTMLYTQQRQDSPERPYPSYQEGYQPGQSMPETYREGGIQLPYPQPTQEYDQPHVMHPEEQEMPGQQ